MRRSNILIKNIYTGGGGNETKTIKKKKKQTEKKILGCEKGDGDNIIIRNNKTRLNKIYFITIILITIIITSPEGDKRGSLYVWVGGGVLKYKRI